MTHTWTWQANATTPADVSVWAEAHVTLAGSSVNGLPRRATWLGQPFVTPDHTTVGNIIKERRRQVKQSLKERTRSFTSILHKRGERVHCLHHLTRSLIRQQRKGRRRRRRTRAKEAIHATPTPPLSLSLQFRH